VRIATITVISFCVIAVIIVIIIVLLFIFLHGCIDDQIKMYIHYVSIKSLPFLFL